MKPLYLDAEQPFRVELDGPSLVLTADAQAARRFPFSRLSRLLVCGPVELPTAALLECLRRGIPVTFLTGDGALAGFALPAQTRTSRLTDRLEEFLERPDWHAHYDSWRRAAERRQILNALGRLRRRSQDLRPATVSALLDETLDELAGRRSRLEAVAWLEAALATLLSELITAMGMAPDLIAERRPGFHLLRDFTGLLLWRLKAEFAAALAEKTLSAAAGRLWRRQLAAWFEQRGAAERTRARRLLDGFSFWLGGLR
jgi:hypothetical protein